jgi:hypothetical protein
LTPEKKTRDSMAIGRSSRDGRGLVRSQQKRKMWVEMQEKPSG